ncbi:hypothetical protein [Pseudohalocynthiibacter sp. F2068]|uniref:hypothetical protein n=1 Tax=Pseudohalocynthiibacter sp. F2068 TaxID=2926418 RepID=UPI001FF30D19|nr:hypothetical protein [Pseudohalocynthiibacter sp. F2068]MCK0101826.1 hypothetical protein [Pseudohalocynthiibacter sp. F2068]
MTSKVIPFPALQTYFGSIWERFSASFSSSPISGEALEDTRNRREFIHEMLNRNPDASKGELDVQSMMQIYPGQF